MSWTRVEAAGEQLVQQVLTSPDFGRDATLVVAATSGPFPEQFIWDQPYAEPSGDHEQSLGILVSSDGGGTWTAASGLEVDGVPYRHVQHQGAGASITHRSESTGSPAGACTCRRATS